MSSDHEIERLNVNPGVAGEDQSHAEAIDFLRGADEWVLVVRALDEGEDYARVLAGGSVEFLLGAAAAAHGMAQEAYREALRTAIREGLENDG